MPRIRGGRFSASNDGWAFPIGAAAAAAWVWDAQYEADVLPTSALPAWTKNGSGTEEILSNELHLINSSPNALYYDRSATVTAGNVTAVQYRMRVVSHGAVTPIMSAIDDGANGIQLGFWTNQLRVTDTSDHDYAVDMTVTRVVRLIKIGSSGWNLYVDGTSVMTGTAQYTTASNRIFFGHGSGSYNGESYWDYVYYDLSYLPV